MHDQPFTVGRFERIYDPSAGEPRKWYVNDHTIVRDHTGMWHLIGITHEQIDIPALEKLLQCGSLDHRRRGCDVARRAARFSRAGETRWPPWFDAHEEKQLAHAVASSLTTPQWRKQPFALVADHTESVLWAPHVISHEELLLHVLCGRLRRNATATSACTSRRRRTCSGGRAIRQNPLFIDGFEARDPMVLRVGDRWVMYYTATDPPSGGNHVVAYRTSTDLASWSERGLAFVDPKQGTGAGPTESPFVVQRGEFFYLFLSMRHDYVPGHYADTEVFRSRDPLHWR